MTEARITVHYPAERGRVCLRTDRDWDLDVEPDAREPAFGASHFRIRTLERQMAFKPVLRDAAQTRWAQGDNYYWFGGSEAVDIYPRFNADERAAVSDVQTLCGLGGERTHRFRVFCPPGYDENVLEHYPVVYLQDGPNVFFPEESFSGRDWKVDETLSALDAMQAIRRSIAVAVYPDDRMEDYTLPGYAAYGKYLVQDLVPWIDAHYRTVPEPGQRLVMGSSLGGVVSLYLAWEHCDVFGHAACLSSTFGYRDNLASRIAGEVRRPLTVYLDSGWPGDNFEATRTMRDLLAERGFRHGIDLHYLAFPHAVHDEEAWSSRVHIPLQLCLGRSRAVSRPSRLRTRRVGRSLHGRPANEEAAVA